MLHLLGEENYLVFYNSSNKQTKKSINNLKCLKESSATVYTRNYVPLLGQRYHNIFMGCNWQSETSWKALLLHVYIFDLNREPLKIRTPGTNNLNTNDISDI